jgi:hypothetical protein|tara:strand:+ start:193 stop:303 length:111 start_codon:yes stop_codon:yes gene_type:complete
MIYFKLGQPKLAPEYKVGGFDHTNTHNRGSKGRKIK